MLYILCVEVLACAVRSRSDIKGFLIPGAKGLQYKVGMYADDTTGFVKSIGSLECLFTVVKIYEKGSGAKLTYPKQRPCGWERGNLALMSHLVFLGYPE